MVSRLLANSGWRFLMISGAPAGTCSILVRGSFLNQKMGTREGARRHVALVENEQPARRHHGVPRPRRDHLELVARGPGPGTAAIITIAGVAAALWGFLFPVQRYLARAIAAGSLAPRQEPSSSNNVLGAGLAGVALLGTWGSIQWAPRWASSSSPIRAASRGSTRRSRPRSAPCLSDSGGRGRGKFGRASHTPRCARDRSFVSSVPGQRPV